MKKNISTKAVLSLVGLGLLGSAGMVSAKGFNMPNLTPAEIATMQTTMFQKQATLLGISIDKVKAAWVEGKTLEEIATANGITKDQLAQKIKDERSVQMKAHLKALVDQGVITQAQADSRLATMSKIMSNKSRMDGRGMAHGWFGL
ncbi:MAG: hypothetical protein WA051_00240 [Minisyncoccia bacterium]